MTNKLSDTVRNILVCPYCGSSLNNINEGMICRTCKSQFKLTKKGALDFRLQQPKTYHYDFTLGTSLLPKTMFDFGLLPLNINPEVNFSNIDVPHHLSKSILSYFPKAKNNSSLMLDLGCGNMIHKEVCEHAGFEHVGIDYYSDDAMILGDAHSLPFKNDSFEFILSIAVLEHLRYPFIAMKEAYRILKSNGIFIGTVSFLEPFHCESFYHHTHLGTYNSLQEGGFKIEKISPNKKWTALSAQARSGLFPKMPRLFSNLIIMPIQVFHEIWWKFCSIFSINFKEDKRIRNTAGAFTFIARK